MARGLGLSLCVVSSSRVVPSSYFFYLFPFSALGIKVDLEGENVAADNWVRRNFGTFKKVTFGHIIMTYGIVLVVVFLLK